MEIHIDDMIDFLLFEKGEDVKVNAITQRAVILEAADKISRDADKFIHCKAEINTGDIIGYNDKKYIITSQVIKSTNTYCAKLKQCTYNIAFNFTGDIKRFNTFIETKIMDIATNQYMSLATGTILLTIRENEDSKKIALNQRFINTGRAWEVTGIDRSMPGIMRLYCELSLITADDDMENEIADYYKYAHNYVISVSNQQPVGVTIGETTQLIFVVTSDGTTVETLPEITCTSSNEGVATVTNTGLITGISDGTAVITCTIVGYTNASTQVNVEVTSIVEDSFSVTISGYPELKIGGSARTYTATVYNNGIEVTDKAVNWSLSNQDGSTEARANITYSDIMTCKLQAIYDDNINNIGEVIILKAELADDSSIFYEYQITLISLY